MCYIQMLQKGILFSHSRSLCMCVGDCTEGNGGHQTASSVLLYDALPHLLPWASLSLGFETSVALVGPWAPRTYLSLCQKCSWACMWVWWAQLMCSRSQSKHSYPLSHLWTPLPLWDRTVMYSEQQRTTQTLAVSVPIHEWIFQDLCSTPIAEKWTHVCQA